MWDSATGEQITSLYGFEGSLYGVSPDGTRIATASDDGAARVWNTATGDEIAVLGRHERFVSRASFSTDGSRIVTWSAEGTGRVWNAKTGEEVAILSGHEGQVGAARFSPNGSRLVAVSDSRAVHLWDARTGEEVAILSGHSGQILTASFSPNGSRIVTGVLDGTARVWDAATGEEVAVLRPQDTSVVVAWLNTSGQRTPLTPILSASFSPDGSQILTAGHTETRVWHSTPWRERRLKLDRYRQAMTLVTPYVDTMFDGGVKPLEIGERIQHDQSLNDTQRRAALNLLLKRCSERREAER